MWLDIIVLMEWPEGLVVLDAVMAESAKRMIATEVMIVDSVNSHSCRCSDGVARVNLMG